VKLFDNKRVSQRLGFSLEGKRGTLEIEITNEKAKSPQK
jgi:hypothetical protein